MEMDLHQHQCILLIIENLMELGGSFHLQMQLLRIIVRLNMTVSQQELLLRTLSQLGLLKKSELPKKGLMEDILRCLMWLRLIIVVLDLVMMVLSSQTLQGWEVQCYILLHLLQGQLLMV